MSFKVYVSLFIFCLDDPSIDVKEDFFMWEFNCGSLEALGILKLWIAYCKMRATATIISSIMAPAARQVFSFTKECSNKIKQNKELLSFPGGNVGGHKDHKILFYL